MARTIQLSMPRRIGGVTKTTLPKSTFMKKRTPIEAVPKMPMKGIKMTVEKPEALGRPMMDAGVVGGVKKIKSRAVPYKTYR